MNEPQVLVTGGTGVLGRRVVDRLMLGVGLRGNYGRKEI